MNYKIITAIFFFSVAIFPQSKDTLYHLSVDAGLGYSRYLTTLDFPDLNQNGFSGTVRVMWHPEHLLSLGLETGYQYLYSIKSTITVPGAGTSEAYVSMNCVPILTVYSMKIFPRLLPKLELKFGSGIFLLYNRGNVLGEINNSQISIAYSGAVTYLQPLNDLISIGGEMKYSYISKIQDAYFSVQLMISYKFLSW